MMHSQPRCPKCRIGRLQPVGSFMSDECTLVGRESVEIIRLGCLTCRTYMDLRPASVVGHPPGVFSSDSMAKPS